MRSLALLLLLGLSRGVYAQEWATIPTDAPNIQFVVDLASIERKDNVVVFEERLTYDKADKTDPASGLLIKEKLVRRVMDCSNKTQGMLTGSMRSDTGVLIELVTLERSQITMTPIPAGTLAEHELELICGRTKSPAPK